MIMYYKERLDNNHMIDINRTLDTVVAEHLKLPGDAHQLLVQWGNHIHIDFLRNNAHLLTTSSAETAENQVLQSIRLMTETIAQQRVQLSQQSEQLIHINKTLTCVATTLLELQDTMKQNTDFAVHCITTQGAKATSTASVTSPFPASPPAPGTSPSSKMSASCHTCFKSSGSDLSP